MTEQTKAPAGGPWEAYAPDRAEPWNLARVVHLHRRAGFAATWGEIRRDLKDGPRGSIDRLMAGEATRHHVPADFERTASLLADGAITTNDPDRLKAAWTYRMLLGPDPMTERLALVWHDHFATSNAKVDDLAAMRRQNDLFRKHARGRFAELLGAVVKDPALLIWLDAPANRKAHPNENLARVLMELFTLGVGNFTEKDVKEAARALTGWAVRADAFADEPARHDGAEKTILGKKGRHTGDDLLAMLLAHPATARRLASRVCEWLLGEGAADVRAVGVLADNLRRHQLDIRWAVETVLRSRTFFAGTNLRKRVLGPAEFVVGAARALESFDPVPSTLELASWLGKLGQELFYPPNVGGWPGGRHWLSTRTLAGRVRFAFALTGEDCLGRGKPLDALGLARKHGATADRDGLLDFFTRLLLGVEPDASWRKRMHAALPAGGEEAAAARRVVALILASPEAQLG